MTAWFLFSLPLCFHASPDVWLIIEETAAPVAGSGSVMSGPAKITVTEVSGGGGGGGQCQSESDKGARCAATGSFRRFFFLLLLL